MALVDIYMLTLTQRWGVGGEKLQNNFFFEKNLLGTNASTLVDHFVVAGAYLAKINAIQHGIVQNDTIKCINLGVPTDFEERVLTGAGAAGGDAMPIFCAIGYGIKLNTRAIRPGSKRFAGVAETHQVNGIITDATEITKINDLAAAMATSLPFGAAAAYGHVVVKRVKYTLDAGLPTEREAYRLPIDDSELVVGGVTGVLTSLRVAHQTSRGNGR